MSAVYVAGRKVVLGPKRMLGQGGEAEVYRLGRKQALKVWKTPDHPDYQGLPGEQLAAEQRIAEQQAKIPKFPKNMPPRVVAPRDLALDKGGKNILGYVMDRVVRAEMIYRLAEKNFRQSLADPDLTRRVFLDLYDTLLALHGQGVVVGDFNDTNVLVEGDRAWLIDCDSFQFQNFPCRVFTQRFLDPLLFDPRGSGPSLAGKYGPESDWYAFAVMLMRSLLFVGPYGGVFRPADPAQRMPEAHRPTHRISVFDKRVRYPKPALALYSLPDDLLHYLHACFVDDQRQVLPRPLLAKLNWSECTRCGRQHARASCPDCGGKGQAGQPPVVRATGDLVVSQVLPPDARVVALKSWQGQLYWLVHRDGQYLREDGRVVLTGDWDPSLRVQLGPDQTLVASAGRVVSLPSGESLAVEQGPDGPAVWCNRDVLFRIDSGLLIRQGPAGPETLGQVLSGLTRFWLGDEFGLGFYRAGALQVAFLVDCLGNRFDDSLVLPRLVGQLLEAHCTFAKNRVWFFWREQVFGQAQNRCLCLDSQGNLVGQAEARAGDGGWLGAVGGACAVGDALLAPTDEGLVRVEASGGLLLPGRDFPASEPFVDQQCRLLACGQGLAVTAGDGIRLMRMA